MHNKWIGKQARKRPDRKYKELGKNYKQVAASEQRITIE